MKLISSSLTLAAMTLIAVSCGSKKSDSYAGMVESVDVAYPVVDSVVLHKEYPGTLTAVNSVDLVARVDGYLRFSDYEPGSYVPKGTVLFRIEDTKYREAVNQAQAQLATAQATNTYATNQYHAMKKALESDAVSQMDVIQAESSMKESQAAINNARAALTAAQTTLSYCTIRAPFNGHVTKSAYSDGAYVGGSMQPVTLATIYDDKVLYANFAIADGQYLQMINSDNSGQKLNYDSIPIAFSQELPHSYTGKLNYLAPQIDPSTGTMSIRASIDNKYGELKPGMYAKISLPYGVNPNAILVKDASIGTDQLGKYLYVVNDSNKVVYTPIEVGELVNDTLRIVTKGIDARSRYVTKAILKVRDGMEVKPVVTK